MTPEEILNVEKSIVLVDMTKLNLAEVTRKKVKKSLREQLGSYDYHRN